MNEPYLMFADGEELWTVHAEDWEVGMRGFIPSDRKTPTGAVWGEWVKIKSPDDAKRAKKRGAIFLAPSGNGWPVPRSLRLNGSRGDLVEVRRRNRKARAAARRKAEKMNKEREDATRQRNVNKWVQEGRRKAGRTAPEYGEPGYVPPSLYNKRYVKRLRQYLVIRNAVWGSKTKEPFTFYDFALMRRDRRMKRYRLFEEERAKQRTTGAIRRRNILGFERKPEYPQTRPSRGFRTRPQTRPSPMRRHRNRAGSLYPRRRVSDGILLGRDRIERVKRGAGSKSRAHPVRPVSRPTGVELDRTRKTVQRSRTPRAQPSPSPLSSRQTGQVERASKPTERERIFARDGDSVVQKPGTRDVPVTAPPSLIDRVLQGKKDIRKGASGRRPRAGEPPKPEPAKRARKPKQKEAQRLKPKRPGALGPADGTRLAWPTGKAMSNSMMRHALADTLTPGRATPLTPSETDRERRRQREALKTRAASSSSSQPPHLEVFAKRLDVLIAKERDPKRIAELKEERGNLEKALTARVKTRLEAASRPPPPSPRRTEARDHHSRGADKRATQEPRRSMARKPATRPSPASPGERPKQRAPPTPTMKPPHDKRVYPAGRIVRPTSSPPTRPVPRPTMKPRKPVERTVPKRPPVEASSKRPTRASDFAVNRTSPPGKGLELRPGRNRTL